MTWGEIVEKAGKWIAGDGLKVVVPFLAFYLGRWSMRKKSIQALAAEDVGDLAEVLRRLGEDILIHQGGKPTQEAGTLCQSRAALAVRKREWSSKRRRVQDVLKRNVGEELEKRALQWWDDLAADGGLITNRNQVAESSVRDKARKTHDDFVIWLSRLRYRVHSWKVKVQVKD